VAVRQDELISRCDEVDLARDRMLVERCQAGDGAAFANLYARYYDRLLRFCLRRLHDRHEAEDAAQEAFARAWKALPRFAGERRFYPWLTVIAGNICTDTLRRRSRSTPTDEMELTAQHSAGVVEDQTSEELVLASVDGELVNRALGRLSARHRHVLAMREGSGWTYQQIADHEGVEIGTIETLLWRARQALKREYAIVCDSKGALAGFLVGAAAFVRRSVVRFAHRGSSARQPGSGAAGDLRNAVAGIAVTGAAVAAAFITPHALAPRPTAPPAAAGAGAVLAVPPLLVGHAAPAGAVPANNNGAIASGPGTGSRVGASTIDGTSSGAGSVPKVGSRSLLGGPAPTTAAAGAAGAAGTAGGSVLHQAAGGVSGVVGGATSGVSGVVGGVAGAAGGVAASAGAGAATGGVAQTLNGVSQAIGLGSVVPGGSSGSGGSTSPASGTSSGSGSGSGSSGPLGGLTTKVGSAAGGLLGG
jgi:RNA polymerase sigma-70 factor (ECF subfamily)